MCSTTFEDVFFPEFAPAPDVDRPTSPPFCAATEVNALARSLVTIRPFQSADALPMYEAARESMEQLRAWMTWCRPDFSLRHAEAFVAQSAGTWERGEQYSFAIIDDQDGSFLGSVGLNHLNHSHKLANVGYWVRTGAAGRGVATVATRSIVTFGLGHLGLNRLEFLIPAVNVASQRVAQKLGAKFEGLLRQRLVLSGQDHDAVLYAMTKADARGKF